MIGQVSARPKSPQGRPTQIRGMDVSEADGRAGRTSLLECERSLILEIIW